MYVIQATKLFSTSESCYSSYNKTGGYVVYMYMYIHVVPYSRYF